MYLNMREIYNMSLVINDNMVTGYTNAEKHLVIPVGIRTIGKSAFRNNTELETLILPEGLETIEDYAFEKCNNLKSVLFPDSLLYIGINAFSDTALVELSLPNRLERIRTGSFQCIKIKQLEFPDSLKVIDPYAFFGCRQLETIHLKKSIKSIKLCAFGYCNIQRIEIPSTKISTDAFWCCEQLKEIVFIRNRLELSEKAVKKALDNHCFHFVTDCKRLFIAKESKSGQSKYFIVTPDNSDD